MSRYRRVELIEGEPVVFLAVHALRWPWDVLEPTAGFVEDTDEEDDGLRAQLAAEHARAERLVAALAVMAKITDNLTYKANEAQEWAEFWRGEGKDKELAVLCEADMAALKAVTPEDCGEFAATILG